MKKIILRISVCLLALSSFAQTGNPYTWPVYNPNISYNFRDEFPTLPQPNNVLNDCPEVVGTTSSGWWCFRWGPDRNPVLKDAAIPKLLERLNTDFAYFRDTMGWPPDLRAKSGYKSAVYLFGSGLCTDNAANTELGGWQSAIRYNNKSWPMILASYYPIQSFDPASTYNDKEFQKGAMTHEGIHALLADLPGVKQSAWFHEGGNVWLQQTADARRSGNYKSVGDLNGTDFIAPFMPIESYTGWLLDGTFGGPSAEGVNKYNSEGAQLCTWRRYLGGHQYSSTFPTFLGLALGNGSVPWIWRNSPTRVLAGINSGIGETQTRRLITEYRAKMALVDFGVWRVACLALLDAHFGQSLAAEWQPSSSTPPAWKATPYAATTNNAGLLTPDPLTLPGWSGSNQIPLKVTGNVATVNFQPIGTNMTCQLVYRSTNGTPVYSQFVSSGDCSLKLDLPPASGVVIAVITNTDHIYNGEATRTAKFDYKLKLGTGLTVADINTKWYNSAKLVTGLEDEGTVGANWSNYCSYTSQSNNGSTSLHSIVEEHHFHIFPNPTASNDQVSICLTHDHAENSEISILSETGVKVFEGITFGTNYIVNTKDFQKGVYFVRVKNSETNSAQKLVIK